MAKKLKSLIALSFVLCSCSHFQQQLERKGWISGEDRRREYIAAHPELTEQERQLIEAGRLALGIRAEVAAASWGTPDDINRSVGSWGVHEQWVYEVGKYSHKYLYIENGKLSSWQN